MTLELTAAAALATTPPNRDGSSAGAPALPPAAERDRSPAGPCRTALLASAWHSVAAASQRLDRLQDLLRDLGAAASETPVL
jgi:hypothetical protein